MSSPPERTADGRRSFWYKFEIYLFGGRTKKKKEKKEGISFMNRWGSPAVPSSLPRAVAATRSTSSRSSSKSVSGYVRQWEAKGAEASWGLACPFLGLFWSVNPPVALLDPLSRSSLLSSVRDRVDCSSSVIPPRSVLKGRAGLVMEGREGGGLQVEGLEGSSCWSKLQGASQKCSDVLKCALCIQTSSTHSGQTVGEVRGWEAAATTASGSSVVFFSFFSLIFL